MKKLFLLLALPFVLMACDDEKDLPQPVPQADMTVMAYLVADASSIEDDIWTNIAAMYDGLSVMDKSATLLIYWDGSGSYGPWDYPVILRYETDGKGNINGQQPLLEDATVEEVVELAEVIKEYPSQLSTDKKVMGKVLNDMIGFAPTTKVGLIAASHGSAWINSIFMSRSVSRSFGQDGKGTDNTMLISDMAEAMKGTGKKFDFLLFDACFMCTAEVCYDLRDAANYQISSVMEVPAYGFPYEISLEYLYEGTADGYKQMCQSFVDFYQQRYDNGYQAWATIALVYSKEMESLTQLIHQEIVEHKDVLGDGYDVSDLQEYGRRGGADIAYDLGHLMKNLNEGTIPASFVSQLDKTVLYKGCMERANPSDYGVDVSNYCGMGIYVPVSYRRDWNQYFKTLDWYTASGWNEVTFSWDF